jgi:glyoxylase I family protein
MSIKLCHHHGFTVSDLDRSVEFYTNFLGLELVRISERSNLPSYDHILGFEDVHLKIALLKHPSTDFLLELFEYLNPPSSPRDMKNNIVGSSHVAFEVEDIDATYEALCDGGYRAINCPIDIERDGKKVARAIYALDPDGISVELMQMYGDIVSG